MHRIVIDVDYEHRIGFDVWIFAEDVARVCNRDGHARVSLADVDRMTDRLVVEVHSASHVRRLIKAIEDVAAKHHLAERVLVTHEKYGL